MTHPRTVTITFADGSQQTLIADQGNRLMRAHFGANTYVSWWWQPRLNRPMPKGGKASPALVNNGPETTA